MENMSTPMIHTTEPSVFTGLAHSRWTVQQAAQKNSCPWEQVRKTKTFEMVFPARSGWWFLALCEGGSNRLAAGFDT